MRDKKNGQLNSCFHCGDVCQNDRIHLQEKIFCCQGCKTVFEILNKHNLEGYYELEQAPGIKRDREQRFSDYEYLDLPEVRSELLEFSSGKMESVNFKVPSIHCTSCIWLLENLDKIQPGVIKSEANFLKKESRFQYDPSRISMKKLVELLDNLGYKPDIEVQEKNKIISNRKKNLSYIYRLGIAGFSFGNIMLLSFPEYLSEGLYEDEMFGNFFGYVNLLLALPVFFYCAWPYFNSAWKSVKAKFLNIDVPIALGILVLFSRSTYEVLSQSGAGYFDSMTGLVFFLLIGRWFQNRTYQALSFERDYRSYFPLAITKVSNGIEKQVLLKEIKTGDQLIIRNGEIIPADSKLISGNAKIDYSFVTGEAEPVDVNIGSELFAGGRQNGGQLKIEIQHEFSQSYLMQLWKNEDRSTQKKEETKKLIDKVSQYFTLAILIIAALTTAYWAFNDPSKIIISVTAVLIIACPCALALTIPFTYGNGLRLLEKAGIYLRDSKFIERLAEIDTIVFDKTGTITAQKVKQVQFIGSELNDKEKNIIKSLTSHSNHPLSRTINISISPSETLVSDEFEEHLGFGITGKSMGQSVKLGSSAFFENESVSNGTAVHVEINDNYKGYFLIGNIYRSGLEQLILKLSPRFKLEVMTGDTDGEMQNLRRFFGAKSKLQFRMNPMDKLNYVRAIKNDGHKILMIGDGLNDAGAIRESHVGLSISDDIYGFLPSCDGILEAESFNKLDRILNFSRKSKKLVWVGFVISFLYNVLGLSFAVQGILSPVVAAILMPLSSITVVAFAILSTEIAARKAL